MKVFLDTSSLFKLYHREDGTDELELIFSTEKISTVYLSDLTKVEFASTVWKKVRTKEITESQALATIQSFEADFVKYAFIAVDSIVTEQARILIMKYGAKGLRALDSIQLSTAVCLAQDADVFFAADNLLRSFLETEYLPIALPDTDSDRSIAIL